MKSDQSKTKAVLIREVQSLRKRVGAQDITERKEAEERLRSSEERLKILFDYAPDGYYLNDLKGYFIDGNKAAEKITGYNREELKGKSFLKLNLLPLAQIPKAVTLLAQNALGQPTGPDEFLLNRKDGNQVWVEIRTFPVKINGNTVVLGSARDITERKRAENKLKESEERHRLLSQQLEDANNLKELLLDVITHDLKNPAGVISGMTDIIAAENPTDETIQLVKQSSDDLLRVVANASALSRIALGEEIEKVEVDLAELIDQVAGEFAPFLERAGMSLEIHFPEPLPALVNPIIAQVFRNYISNAIKYAALGKKIVIEAQKKVGTVIVGVKDFGQAIPKKDYPRIWTRGIRLEENAKRGRGLGLAIVKRIAEAHGGEVWIEPNKPRGNVFFLKLPCK